MTQPEERRFHALSTIFVHAVNSKPDYVGYLKEACDFCS